MIIIDETYFRKGLMTVPARQDLIDKLKMAIEEYEPEFLTMLLGEVLYKDFMAGLNTNPLPVEWKALLDTLIYPEKVSPIANYVFIKFYTDNANLFIGTNDVSPNTENSVKADRYRVVNVWNKMVNMNREAYKFMTENEDFEYPDLQSDITLYRLDNMYGV